jgi:hypothetical protein
MVCNAEKSAGDTACLNMIDCSFAGGGCPIHRHEYPRRPKGETRKNQQMTNGRAVAFVFLIDAQMSANYSAQRVASRQGYLTNILFVRRRLLSRIVLCAGHVHCSVS